MSAPDPLPQIFEFIDSNRDRYIETLKEAVAIKSISTDVSYREDVMRMIIWTQDKFEQLGMNSELAELGTMTMEDGSEVSIPPVLLASIGEDPAKRTIVVYCHLDVQPASIEDGWETDPWVLTERDGKLYGRGSTDDKAPVLEWVHVVEAYKSLELEIPVNLKFVFESMEESGSEGLDDLLFKLEDTFLHDVDFVCITDTYWLGCNKPCIGYALRGLVEYAIEVECANMDLHSGVFGGAVPEAMSDLIYMMNSLIDINGNILVPKLMDDVAPVTPDEEKIYDEMEFDINEYRAEVGSNKLLYNEDKKQILMHKWRYPSLSMHGIEGAFYGPGGKTVIPRKVTGKFSIRIVPNQKTEKVEKIVVDYLNEQWKLRGSLNGYKAYVVSSAECWHSDPSHPHYLAAARAVKHVFKVDPDYIREGGSVPITLTFEQVTGQNVILLALGCGDDGNHSQNEKVNIRNYIEGTKLLAAYMHEVSLLPKPVKNASGMAGKSKCKSQGRDPKCKKANRCSL